MPCSSGAPRETRAWGQAVRAAAPEPGRWPSIAIWQGTADSVVKPINAGELVKQWTSVHGVAAQVPKEDNLGTTTRRIWRDAGGHACVTEYSVPGLGHGMPVADDAPPAPFFLPAGLSAAEQIARDFGLVSASPRRGFLAGLGARRLTERIPPERACGTGGRSASSIGRPQPHVTGKRGGRRDGLVGAGRQGVRPACLEGIDPSCDVRAQSAILLAGLALPGPRSCRVMRTRSRPTRRGVVELFTSQSCPQLSARGRTRRPNWRASPARSRCPTPSATGDYVGWQDTLAAAGISSSASTPMRRSAATIAFSPTPQAIVDGRAVEPGADKDAILRDMSDLQASGQALGVPLEVSETDGRLHNCGRRRPRRAARAPRAP